jgi:hypothetical protein
MQRDVKHDSRPCRWRFAGDSRGDANPLHLNGFADLPLLAP